jgi:hypothetical protein
VGGAGGTITSIAAIKQHSVSSNFTMTLWNSMSFDASSAPILLMIVSRITVSLSSRVAGQSNRWHTARVLIRLSGTLLTAAPMLLSLLLVERSGDEPLALISRFGAAWVKVWCHG